MNRQFRLPVLASAGIGLGLSLCAATSAEEFEQHGAHEHGAITLNIAVEKQELSIELDAPAVNVVGFEHAPQTDAERAAITDAATLLKSGTGLFGLPPEARCRLAATKLAPPHWEETHEHEHHADYGALFTYVCASPDRLRWLEPWLLARLLNVHEARINLITSAGQRSQAVTGAHDRVPLQPVRP